MAKGDGTKKKIVCVRVHVCVSEHLFLQPHTEEQGKLAEPIFTQRWVLLLPWQIEMG